MDRLSVPRAFGAAAAALALAACGNGTAVSSPPAQPTPEVTTFQPGAFDDLPLYPRSEPLGPRADEGKVTARSYKATGASPQQILEYYRDTLGARWTLVGRIDQVGVGTYQADWTSGDRRLRVSASRAPALEGGGDGGGVVSQYSLTLRPLSEP